MNMLKKYFIRPLLRAVSLLLMLAPSVAMAQTESYTLGIGTYPGRPSENFAPKLKPSSSYRNIALRRMAVASSSYDFNLTAQLVTDGIESTLAPCWLEAYTQQGPLSREYREMAFDDNPTWVPVASTDGAATLTFAWHQMKLSFDEVRVYAAVDFDRQLSDGRYEAQLLSSADGRHWTSLASCSGASIDSTGSWETQFCPYEKSGDKRFVIRKSGMTFRLGRTVTSAYLRLQMRLKGSDHWHVMALEPWLKGQKQDALPSQHFSSAWKSGVGEKQWLYVDLGSESDFDKVDITWLKAPLSAVLETSEDAAKWTRLSTLPQPKAGRQTVKCQGRARYLRISMTQASAGGIEMGELRVMGRGGLVAEPKLMEGRQGKRFSLAGGQWMLQRASEVKADGQQLSSKTYVPKDWITATVPGTVLTSLINLGAVPNPNLGSSVEQISDSYFRSDFWYRTVFKLSHQQPGKRTFLHFDGVNWKAEVWLNGHKVDYIEGAFKRGNVDVTPYLQEGDNVVAVRVVHNAHYGAVKEKTRFTTQFNGGILGADNPTMHASIGWDWITTVRGRNMGIWNDVYLTTSGDITLADPYVRSKVKATESLATITPSVFVRNHSNHAVTGTLSCHVGTLKAEQKVSLGAGEEREIFFAAADFPQFNNQRMRLWWPNGYGDPYLYSAGFAFTADGSLSDSISFKAGIREFSYTDKDTQLRIYCNGKRIVPLGGNWGFSEQNLNYRAREYETAVAFHRDMHYTMIRDWVGMIGDAPFYDACDANGILIWQDFWLANPSDGPNPYYESMFLDNANDYVRRIRSHAAIALYCGRNEGNPPATLNPQLEACVEKLAPGTVYIPNSAHYGVSGEGPYCLHPDADYFKLQSGKLHSERGIPNVMSPESMKRTFSSDSLWPQTAEWGKHDFTLYGAQRAETFNQLITDGFGDISSADDFSRFGQLLCYNGYRAMYEGEHKYRMGLLSWMSHSCWPSMVWDSYDYFFDTPAGYYGIKKACEPLHVQWNALTDSIEVVNLGQGDHKGLQIKARIVELSGKTLWQKTVSVDSPDDSTLKVLKPEVPSDVEDVYLIRLDLTDADGKVVSQNTYIRGRRDGHYEAVRTMPKATVVFAEKALESVEEGSKLTFVVSNKSDCPALMVRLNLKGTDGEQILPAFYSDNFLTLLPGESVPVTISWRSEDSRGCQPSVELDGINVASTLLK